MKNNSYKVIKGTDIRPEAIRNAKAVALYRVAVRHPFVSGVSCRITSKGDILILMTVDSEVPDQPKYDIHEKEPIAIKVSKNDDRMPEVYALRNDFPLGLPHTNAVPFDHPVSLCVSDVMYQDIRTKFSAFEFIEQTRGWFARNACGELHEKDRPLEVYYSTEEFSYFPVKLGLDNTYFFARYRKVSDYTSVIEETAENDANYGAIPIPVNINVAGYVRRIPQKLGEFRDFKIYNGYPFIDAILNVIRKSPRLQKSTKPLMLALIMPMARGDGEQFEDVHLFALRIDEPICSIVGKLSRFDKAQADRYLDNQDVKISFLLPGLSKESLSNSSGIQHQQKEITLLGTGALGSQILDGIVRCGYADTVHIVDADFMAPHNVARHVLDVKDVMNRKVYALKEKYRGIDGLKIYTYAEDILRVKEHDEKRLFSTVGLVIDASTSVGVERHIALDLDQYGNRRCTTFLNPKGTDAVLLLEDKERKHRLDLLEMDYYRSIVRDERLSEHLATSGSRRTNIFCCRAESVVMDFSNVSALSAIVTTHIFKRSATDEARLGLWHINGDEGSVTYQDLPISDWSRYKAGSVTIYVSNAVLNEMERQREEKLKQPKSVETGGTFVGAYDRDRNLIYVADMIEAPDDSVEAGASYIRGVEGLEDKIEKIKERTGHQLTYIGEWHSHPHGCSNAPSADDMKLFTTMSDEMQRGDYPFVMGILGDSGMSVKVTM